MVFSAAALRSRALFVSLAFYGSFAFAQAEPVPPCSGMPVPSAGRVGDALNQLVWMADELPTGWVPPDCTGWVAGPTNVLLAAAGRFRLPGGSVALVERLTKVSGLTDIVYWSTSRGKWRNLFKDAVALTRADPTARRADFMAAEFVPGADIYYWSEEDNPTVGVVSQVVVHERTQDRLVYEVVNLTELRAKLLFFRRQVAAPGEFRQLYFLEREDDDTWHYYTLVRMGQAASLVGTSAANYRNRAAAFFRYLAGIKMDREPPAAP